MKYKYYWKKPKSEITKDLLTAIAISGVLTVASTSPSFGPNLLHTLTKQKKYPNRKVYDTFYRLRKAGYLSVVYKNHQMYISLTPEGKAKAGWMQINDLKIKKQKKWDRKWRIVIFDVAQEHRMKREALRGFLKGLEFYQLQKSVWIHPYDCGDEVGLLKNFFGFSDDSLRVVVAKDIGDDSVVRKAFRLP